MVIVFLIREILRLFSCHSELSHRRIEAITGCPHQTVGRIHSRFVSSGLTFEETEKLDDVELRLALYPKAKSKSSQKIKPDFKYIRKELFRKHKNRKSIMVMYLEYKAKYGTSGYSRAQFYKLVKEAIKAEKVVMKQIYLPGEILFIDFLGLTLSYFNEGNEVKLYVFVCCLGYSKRMFMYATTDMTSVSWCEAIVKAFEYFGGVPDVVQFDNAKAMVITPGQLAELHRNIRELAQFFGNACDTSRVGTPSDNGGAEEVAKFGGQRIVVPMKRDLKFHSREEVNRHLLREVEKLNNEPLQIRGISRNELFFADEQHELGKLPAKRYEPVIYRKEIQTPATYLIRYENNEYSVPFELAHKRIEIKVRGGKLYVLYLGKVRAIHDVIETPNNVIRLNEHLKPEHLAELNKNKDYFLEWANGVGESTAQIVELQYRGFKNPSSRVAGKYCSRLQKLCVKYGEQVFEEACSYAYTHNMHSPNDLELILKARPFETDDALEQVVAHDNVRGPEYFGGARHD